jgi:hypothetical protein
MDTCVVDRSSWFEGVLWGILQGCKLPMRVAMTNMASEKKECIEIY